MTDGEEVTIREGTVLTLKHSIAGFQELKQSFKNVSESFAATKYIEGLEVIKTFVIPNTSAMYSFFNSLVQNMSVVFGEELTDSLIDKLKAIVEIMQTLDKETPQGHFNEIGEILEFDYFDLLTEMEGMIPHLIEKVETSTIKELDLY